MEVIGQIPSSEVGSIYGDSLGTILRFLGLGKRCDSLWQSVRRTDLLLISASSPVPPGGGGEGGVIVDI